MEEVCLLAVAFACCFVEEEMLLLTWLALLAIGGTFCAAWDFGRALHASSFDQEKAGFA